MNDLWNNTCVLINNNGNVFLSNPLLKGHNQAISDCASKIGLNIPEEQSMVSMLHILTTNNCLVLLNCGKTTIDNIEKRTGYLALPQTFSTEQIEQIEILKLLLDEYNALTVWKQENNSLKTKSMGNNSLAISLIQEMINNTQNIESENKEK